MFFLEKHPVTKVQPDSWLFVVCGMLLLLGVVMVMSASMYTAVHYNVSPYYYGIRQLFFIAAGLVLGFFAFKISLEQWYRLTPLLIAFSFLLLIAVLIPGIGREVNGAMRWIPLGIMNVQPSELVKLFAFIYIAGYLQRHYAGLRQSTIAMMIPLFVLGLIGILLLLEPDFGSTAVMFVVGLGMIFIAGVSLWRFGVILSLTVGLMSLILYSSPYRRARLSSFLNPWEDEYNQGFQLTNSLMAIGRGEFKGVGIGESVQKLGYLPEAHTDFIFAIYAEETGLIGVVFLIFLFITLVTRAFVIGRRAEVLGLQFGAYLAYGIGLWIGAQAFINMAVAMGVLPTKGLTLPLISYGGSSIITMIIALAMLFRIDIDAQDEQLNQQKRVSHE